MTAGHCTGHLSRAALLIQRLRVSNKSIYAKKCIPFDMRPVDRSTDTKTFTSLFSFMGSIHLQAWNEMIHEAKTNLNS